LRVPSGAAPGTQLGGSGKLGSNDGTSISPGVDLATGALGRGFYGLAFQASNFAALLNFLQTQGDVQAALALDATLLAHKNHWLVRETIGLLRRTFSRLDVSSRSLFALIEPGSCFAGSLLELALACDRSYQLILPDDADKTPKNTDSHHTGLYEPKYSNA
jgi:benzoyl-CoA-dihydrodiol lyase